MFWVTDNFLMKKPKRSSRKRAVRYSRVNGSTNNNEDNDAGDSDTLLSGDEDVLVDGETLGSAGSGTTTPLAFKNVEELLLNVNRRNNSVV